MIKNERYLSRIFLWVLTLGDLALVAASYGAGYALRFKSGLMGPFPPEALSPRAYWYAGPVVLAVFWTVFKYLGLYKRRRGISSVDEFTKLFNGTLFAMLLLSALAFFIREFHFSIKVFLAAAGLSLFSLLAWRTLLRWAQIRARQRGLGVVRSVVVGSGAMAKKLVERAKANPGMGYRLVGLVDDGAEARKAAKAWGLPWLGGVKKLNAAVKASGADCVIVALPPARHHLTHEILLGFDAGGVELRIVSDLYGFITSPMAVDEIHGIPVFALKEAPLDRPGNRALKRAFDLLLVVPGLVLISPLMLLVAALIKLDSKGPAFYRQERVGRDNKVFGMLKFRSMREDAETSGPGWTRKDDPRRTRLGGFLRKSSIDELPQLFNVLLGQMSLVGPRPERPHYVEKFKASIPRYLQRHQVKAGISGWAQVHGWRGDTSIEERTAFDLYYVENWSLSLDLLILVKTLLELFEQDTAY
jgi:exopolysaccharide biosynthesis polyprenyl glycosylphosphotransferase